MTWEDAILWLREHEGQHELVRQCYYDDPLEDAAERFRASEEWTATRHLLRGLLPCRVLDVGAGRGIASYAFARAGCAVIAVEPEASAVVGRGAIQRLGRRTNQKLTVVEAHGEALPFAAASFDVVYGRAVLHHALDLSAFCQETARVLRPGGAALFVREHVVSQSADLAAFRAAHPLHALCGGENAYPLAEYEAALTDAGLRLRRVLGPLEDAVNFFPATQTDVDGMVTRWLADRLCGSRTWPARWLLALPCLRRLTTRRLSRRLDTPGRHFAFLGVKP